MRNSPVHWYQGLFIRPHHFQAADRYWSEQQTTSLRWDHPYCYGLHDIQISEEGLKNGELRITKLDARMRDGSLVSLDYGEELHIDLRESLSEETTTVYVGVPKLNPGGKNVSEVGANGVARYYRLERTVKDETGLSNEEDLEFRKLRVDLLAKASDGYELLPIARIKRAGSDSRHPVIDQSYIPPILSIDAWQHLRHDLLDVRGVVEEKMNAKAQVLQQLDRDRIDPSDAPHILLLDRYNEAFTMLDLLLPAQGVHPFGAYRELARILSRLSILSPQRHAIEVLPYNHDDLGTIFQDICEKILRNLDPLVTRYIRENFVGTGSNMMVTLGPHWFDPTWEWYLGVDRVSQRISDLDLDRLLERSRDWFWVFGSRNQVDEFFRVRQSGLKREHVETTIPELPSRERWTFYRVLPDQSRGWDDIEETHTVAIRISRHDEIPIGKRHLDHSMPDGTSIRLSFALFAIQK